MISLYLVPFICLLAGLGSGSLWIFYGLFMLMGIGMVGIGCGIMHDSNHGTLSEKKWINKYMGKIIAIVGGYEKNWRIQHNILHHTYTNIEGLDHDLEAGSLLRFSPNSKHYFMHKFQHVYAWFLYGMLTLRWSFTSDFLAVIKYEKMGLLKKEKLTLKQALIQVTLYKIFYFGLVIALPIAMGLPVLHVVLGFFLMHFIAGLSLSVIFQLAHVMGELHFPSAVTDEKMENSWAEHQLKATANFSPKSFMVNWFVGGLNHQIEHHLFPHISHVHYQKIAPLVRKTAEEFGLPYLVQPTMAHAVIEHGRMLRELGSKA